MMPCPAPPCLQDHEFFQGRLRRLLGDLTFLDAYQRSGEALQEAAERILGAG
jgi:hypothetical protein